MTALGGCPHNSTVFSCHRNLSKIFSCRGFSVWTPQNKRTKSNFKFGSPQLLKFTANRAWFGEQIGSWTKSQYPSDSSTVPVPCARQLPSESWGSQQQLVGHNICLSHKPAAGFISLWFVCSSVSFEHFSGSRFFGGFLHILQWTMELLQRKKNKNVDLLRCGFLFLSYLSRSFGEPGSSRIWPGSIFQQPGRFQHSVNHGNSSYPQLRSCNPINGD